MDNLGETSLDVTGALAPLFSGATGLQSVNAPLTATTDGFGNVTVGGSGNQVCLIPNATGDPRLCNEIAPYPRGIPPNPATSVRYDIIYAQAQEQDTNEQTGTVETPGTPETLYYLTAVGGGNFTATPISAAVGGTAPGPYYQRAQAVRFGYLQGTAGDGIPDAPAGFTTVCVIAVQPNNAVLTDANLSIAIPTFPVAILNQLQPLLPFIIVSGADPTGALDSAAAIQSALNTAASLGINRVLLAGGTYLILSAPLAIPTNVVLEAAGSGATTLLQGTLTTDVVQLGTATAQGLRGVTIQGAAGATSGYGINGGSASGFVANDVLVTGCTVGIYSSGASNWTLIAVRANGNLNDGCDFSSWGGNLLEVGCDFSMNGGNGERFTNPASSGMGALIVATRFALNSTSNPGTAAGLQLDTGIKGVQTAGCRFGQELPSPTSTQGYGIAFMGSNDDVTIDGVINANSVSAIYAPGGLGANVVIRANGYQPNVVAISSFVSGVPWVNNLGVPCQVIVSPNSAPISTIQVNGSTVYTSPPTSGTTPVLVGPGRQLTLNFPSGSPTAVVNPQ